MGLDAELTAYDDLLARFPQIGSTREAGDLAELILQRWQQRAAQRQQRQQSGQTGQSRTGKDGQPGWSSNSCGQDVQDAERGTRQPRSGTDRGKKDASSQTDGTSQSEPARADGTSGGAPGTADGSTGGPATSASAETANGSDSFASGPSHGSGTGGLGRALIGEALVEAINQAVQCAGWLVANPGFSSGIRVMITACAGRFHETSSGEHDDPEGPLASCT